VTESLDILDVLMECIDREEGCVGGILLPCETVGGDDGGQGGRQAGGDVEVLVDSMSTSVLLT
jgi:hypothetical protein